jgi:3-deoxy-7-phosphoheptulonate synthase
MIVIMNQATDAETQKVIEKLKGFGFDIHLSQGVSKTIIGAVGSAKPEDVCGIERMPGVEKVVPIVKPFKLVSREFRPNDTVIRIGDTEIGGNQFVVMAGPCAVESYEQLLEAAQSIKAAGAQFLRGGAFKPRTSPYSFQGLEEEGLKMLQAVRKETGLLIVTEAIDPGSAALVAEYADIIQIGARNMQNFYLLREVAKLNKPVLLKRGMSATIEEWLMAAEYLLAGGNYDVILCERGIRTYETYTRNTLDLSAVPLVKQLSHLPVIVDPSHGTGKWNLVEPMAKAALVAGADGVMIEVHPKPSEAMSDGPQSLTPQNFQGLMNELRVLAGVIGKSL